MKHLIIAFVISILLSSCLSNSEQEIGYEESDYEYLFKSNNNSPKKGIFKIKSVPNYSNPQSVVVDNENSILYVSNQNNSGGYITRVFLNGNIIDTLPIKTLNHPQGMAVVEQKLYITDGNHIIVYNINKESTEKDINIYNSQNLKDIVSDADNNIFVTDASNGYIYKINKNYVEPFIKDSTFTSSNGLCNSDVNIAVAANNSIYIINSINGNKKRFTNLPFTPQGLKAHNDSIFIVSDNYGNIYKTTKTKCIKIINSSDSVSSSYFEYLADQNLLFVPTYYNNTLDVYEIGI
ncbi:MAG: hypothetical protein MJ211_06895 [Bacteroidales bacterium]|nr:hypothetical protein [Bacteroidales bacterium]